MLLNEIHMKVFDEISGNYKGSFTGSYIAKKKNLNQKSVANALNNMENEGILKSTTKGKNKEFSLNMSNIEYLRNVMIAIECLRTADFLKKHPLVKEVITKTRYDFQGIVLLFGSYVKCTQKKDSDLDIFVAGEYNRDRVVEMSETYNLHVSVKNYPLDIFRSSVKNKDILVNEVLKNHIVIDGAKEFVDAVLES